MAAQVVLPAYDAFLDYLVEKATPQEILAFSVSQEDQEHASELLEKQSAGELNPEEHLELERMADLDRLVSLLKAKALAALKAK